MNTNYTANEPESLSKRDVLTALLGRHLNSFMENDLQTLMADYTEESVFITQDKTYTGINEIKLFFTNLLTYFPKQQYTFQLDKMVVGNELAFIVWHADSPTLEVAFGTDTFIIKDEKITQQTFAGVLNFRS